MSKQFLIPKDVKHAARVALELKKAGFKGGMETGIKRAKQLSRNKYVDLDTLRVMNAWFARHGPKARGGGTSYPGYQKWVKAGGPMNPKTPGDKNKYRGAVAWLLWGGDPAFWWVTRLRNQGRLNRK